MPADTARPDEKSMTVIDESTDNDAPTTDDEKPRGVRRMEAIVAGMAFRSRCGLYIGLFLVSYVFSLNYLVTGTYQSYATSTWNNHSLLSTINVVRGVISAAGLPVVAKLSDLIGRLECFFIVSVFFVLGNIIQAAAGNIQAFAVGALFSQICYTSLQLIVEILVADTTSLRTRLFFLFFPTFSNLINVWISGNVTSSVLAVTTWRWGYGMWAIIYPILSIPLVVFFAVMGYRTRKSKENGQPTAARTNTTFMSVVRRLDIIGLFLLCTTLSLILIPLTLAGGESEKWKTPGIITPIVLGALLLPVFLWWETKASHPVLPYSLLKDRAVWAAMGISFFGAMSFTAQSEFLYTVLYVAYDFSIEAATRISVVSSFMEAVGGILGGLIIYIIRRCKPLIFAGCAVWMVAYGLMYHYRGSAGGSDHAGIIAGQVLVGTATAMVTFPNVVISMAVARHQDVSVLTSLWLAVNWAGYAVGNCITGAIWTQVLYGQLEKDLGPFDPSLTAMVYADPFTTVAGYPVGTPERTAIIESYRYIQRLLTITSMALVVPIVLSALCLRNPKMQGKAVSV